jgi:hypothetical protein
MACDEQNAALALVRWIATVAIVAGLSQACSDFAHAQSPAANERTIPSDASFVVDTKWFDGSACADRNKTAFYFSVGKQVFAAPTEAVVRGRLRKIAKATAAPDGRIAVSAPRTAGCKTDPIGFVQVELKVDGNKPGFVVLAETPERSGNASPVARYIQHLSQTGGCKKADQPDLMTCNGSRTENGRTVNIAFFVMDRGNLTSMPPSGIPVHARCEDHGRGTVCMVSEELDNDVTVRAAIDANRLSSKNIQQLRTQLIDFAKRRAVR